MTLFERVVTNLEERRERVLSGKINCIPCPFHRFREEWSGIEQGKYYGITAQQKVGKTKFANYLFLYHPLIYAFNNQDKIRVKFFYFSLEMSEEDLYQQFICHLLYILSRGKYRFSPKELKSTNAGNPISEEILEIIKSDEYRQYFDFFDEHVKIITSITHATGIFKFMQQYAKISGTQHKKTIDFVNNETGEVTPKEVDSHYVPYDPDEYVFCIVDHISLIQPEAGMTLKASMEKLSSTYFVQLRNKYRFIPVVIQQQAIAGESLENVKMNKLKPSVADLGEAKTLSRDYNVLFGLFSPFRHEMHEYLGYPIDEFRDNIRFAEIVIAREGGGGMTCPLYFDGSVDFFKELPRPQNRNEVKEVLNFMRATKGDGQQLKVSMFNIGISKKIFDNNLKTEKSNYGKNRRNFWNVRRRKDHQYNH